MRMHFAVRVVLAAGLAGGCERGPVPPLGLPPNPLVSPDAPKDQPFDAAGAAAAEYRSAVAPYIEQGRKTYPDAKRRFRTGLPAGHHFFVVTRLRDRTGTTEQVFVAVTGIDGNRITGRIASDIRGVKGYQHGDPHTFPEIELVDWLIARPDGTEEGNVVGKFLDEWQKTHPPR